MSDIFNSVEWLAQRAEQLDAAEHAEQTAAQPNPFDTARPATTTPIGDVSERRRAAWLDGMMRHALERLGAAHEGSRNDELNKIAYTLGGIVHLGLDEPAARAALHDVALRIGLTPGETKGTISSGFGKGAAKPMTVDLAERELLNGGLEPADVDGTLAAFWAARPLLTHVFNFARARRVSPWALLGVELARAVATMPPAVVLPPIVAGYGSLNLFVGIVGPSGAGKGGAERTAVEAITMPYTTTATVGSGEGLLHTYVKRKRDGSQDTITSNAMFSVPEVDTLAAVAARQGATLLPELRRAWSGEALGFAYADPTKRLRLEPHAYRLAMLVGIQPGRARVLLGDVDGGTPQRFLWMPAVDRFAPDDVPALPTPLRWNPPDVRKMTRTPYGELGLIEVCDLACKIIDAAATARLRSEADALDGHLLYAQLKVAAGLAVLDGRLVVGDDDWWLAETIMRVSTRTRQAVAEALAEVARGKNRSMAESQAERVQIVDERTAERDEQHEEKATQRILRLLEGGVLLPRHDLRRGVRANHRHAFDEALRGLLEAEQITFVDDDEGVRRYARRS